MLWVLPVLYITDPEFKFVGINFNNKTINGLSLYGEMQMLTKAKLYE